MACKFRELVEKHSLAEISSNLYRYIIWNIMFPVKTKEHFVLLSKYEQRFVP